MKATRRYAAGLAAIVTTTAGLLAGTGLAAGSASAGGFGPFVGPLHRTSVLASTVPGNGDVNPYGVAVVPRTTGDLHRGNVLVSNFNDKANIQGTGTTIVQVTPGGGVSQFAKINRHLRGCPGGVGLTTALTALRSGWVIVGSLPTRNGSISGAGCLIVLDQWGHVRETFRGGGINGPWDMTSLDLGHQAVLFVTNVLNGTVRAKGHVVFGGTVLRLVIKIPAFGLPFIWFDTTIGSGFPERTDPAALVIGPTGVGLGPNGILYVADTLDNRIAGIPNPVFRVFSDGPGFTVSRGHHLNGELGLVIAPNGDILTVNSGNGKLVETTPFGFQVATRQLDSTVVMGSPPGAGALFGLAVKSGHDAVYYVDDATNTLNLLHR
ncbi:MAG TPA: hypothetical protein VGY96_23795 [Streptosporangiaceae bacterium]|nr:hypothetical protein [Streptosporangiaceae bacterium]